MPNPSSIRTLVFSNFLFVIFTIAGVIIVTYFLLGGKSASNTFSKSGTITYTLIGEDGNEYGFTKSNPVTESEYNSSIPKSSNRICQDMPSYVYDVEKGKGQCSSKTQIVQKIFVNNFKDMSSDDVAVINFIRNERWSKTLVPTITEVGGYLFLSPQLRNVELDDKNLLREFEIYEGSSIPIRVKESICGWKLGQEYSIDDSAQSLYIDKDHHKIFYISYYDRSGIQTPIKPGYVKVKSIKKRRVKSKNG